MMARRWNDVDAQMSKSQDEFRIWSSFEHTSTHPDSAGLLWERGPSLSLHLSWSETGCDEVVMSFCVPLTVVAPPPPDRRQSLA